MTVTQIPFRIVTPETIGADRTDVYRVSEYAALAGNVRVTPSMSLACSAVRPHGGLGHKVTPESETGAQYLIGIRDASWGEYDNSSTWQRSNERILTAQFGDWLVSSDNGIGDGTALYLLVGSVVPAELIDIIVGLRDYPVIDEQDMSELEMELADEAWEGYLHWEVPADMLTAATRDMADVMDGLSDGTLREAFFATFSASGNWVEAESATSLTFPGYDDVIATMVAAVDRACEIAVHAGDIEAAFLDAIHGRTECPGQATICGACDPDDLALLSPDDCERGEA